MTTTPAMMATRHRRPTSHRAPNPMPVWQTICLSLAAAAALMVFMFGVIALLTVAFT